MYSMTTKQGSLAEQKRNGVAGKFGAKTTTAPTGALGESAAAERTVNMHADDLYRAAAALASAERAFNEAGVRAHISDLHATHPHAAGAVFQWGIGDSSVGQPLALISKEEELIEGEVESNYPIAMSEEEFEVYTDPDEDAELSVDGMPVRILRFEEYDIEPASEMSLARREAASRIEAYSSGSDATKALLEAFADRFAGDELIGRIQKLEDSTDPDDVWSRILGPALDELEEMTDE